MGKARDAIVLLAAIATIVACAFGIILGAPPALVALRQLQNQTSTHVLATVPSPTVSTNPATDAPRPPTATTVLPTSTSQSPTVVPVGTILYQANWSSGLNGWPATFGWKVLNGMLLNDGSSDDTANFKSNWIAAPYQPRDTVDYAVEAEIQLLRNPACGSFGILVRGGYEAGIYVCPGPHVFFASKDGEVIEDRNFSSPGTQWHKYRIEAKGNTFRIMIDGAVVVEVSDNRYLSSGIVGLWSDHTQINVRSFKVITL